MSTAGRAARRLDTGAASVGLPGGSAADLGRRRHFEEAFHRLDQVQPRFFNCLALADNVQFRAGSDVSISFALDWLTP
jgi:hypothetical protein